MMSRVFAVRGKSARHRREWSSTPNAKPGPCWSWMYAVQGVIPPSTGAVKGGNGLPKLLRSWIMISSTTVGRRSAYPCPEGIDKAHQCPSGGSQRIQAPHTQRGIPRLLETSVLHMASLIQHPRLPKFQNVRLKLFSARMAVL